MLFVNLLLFPFLIELLYSITIFFLYLLNKQNVFHLNNNNHNPIQEHHSTNYPRHLYDHHKRNLLNICFLLNLSFLKDSLVNHPLHIQQIFLFILIANLFMDLNVLLHHIYQISSLLFQFSILPFSPLFIYTNLININILQSFQSKLVKIQYLNLDCVILHITMQIFLIHTFIEFHQLI